MKRTIGLLALALALTAVARFWIFRLQEKDIAPEYYEHKMRVEDFWLQEKSLPSGFRLVPTLPGGKENPATLEPPQLPRIPKPQAQFPSPDKIVAVHAAAYASTVGDQVLLVAAQYSGDAAPDAPPGFLKEGAFLATASSSSPVLRETFVNTLSERLSLLKKDGVKLNKLKTIGNVLIKLFMDILVGTFGFMLALFLVKYFLIIKRVEE